MTLSEFVHVSAQSKEVTITRPTKTITTAIMVEKSILRKGGDERGSR
jgi:hypothetical protein